MPNDHRDSPPEAGNRDGREDYLYRIAEIVRRGYNNPLDCSFEAGPSDRQI